VSHCGKIFIRAWFYLHFQICDFLSHISIEILAFSVGLFLFLALFLFRILLGFVGSHFFVFFSLISRKLLRIAFFLFLFSFFFLGISLGLVGLFFFFFFLFFGISLGFFLHIPSVHALAN